jgi:hypothetical protein
MLDETVEGGVQVNLVRAVPVADAGQVPGAAARQNVTIYGLEKVDAMAHPRSQLRRSRRC